jgi:hypothetical protein
MIWQNKYHPDWVRRFAFTPKKVKGGHTVWLGWYERRFLRVEGRWERRAVV